MSEIRINQYEAMFLFPQAAVSDLEGTLDFTRELLERADAEIIAMGKWDERRLAYDIKGNKRGLYVLAFFRAPANKLASLERDCNLSERLLRAMVVRADGKTDDEMKAAVSEQRTRDEAALRAEEETATADA